MVVGEAQEQSADGGLERPCDEGVSDPAGEVQLGPQDSMTMVSMSSTTVRRISYLALLSPGACAAPLSGMKLLVKP